MEGETQRIARLTPLTQVLGHIDATVRAVEPRRMATAQAVGRILAEDVINAAAVPAGPRALRDGFAVTADATSDASSYAPVSLTPPLRVDVGDALPAGTDAVASLDVVVERDGQFALIAPVAPGDGVLAAGADIGAGTTLLRAGSICAPLMLRRSWQRASSGSRCASFASAWCQRGRSMMQWSRPRSI